MPEFAAFLGRIEPVLASDAASIVQATNTALTLPVDKCTPTCGQVGHLYTEALPQVAPQSGRGIQSERHGPMAGNVS